MPASFSRCKGALHSTYQDAESLQEASGYPMRDPILSGLYGPVYYTDRTVHFYSEMVIYFASESLILYTE